MILRLRMLVRCVVLVVLAGSLIRCMGITPIRYVIPDGYTGFLAVAYACPGGHPVQRDGETIVFVFDAHGVDCIQEGYVDVFPRGARHVDGVATTSGRAIPFLGGEATDLKAWGMIDGGYMEQEGVGAFSISWVGAMQDLAAKQASGALTEERAVFEECWLGLLRATQTKPLGDCTK